MIKDTFARDWRSVAIPLALTSLVVAGALAVAFA